MNIVTRIIFIAVITMMISSCSEREKKLLIFSKTEGFRHDSIEEGIKAITTLAEANGMSVMATEDAEIITEENLNEYSTVIFLNTTGDILDYSQQATFERYIQAGGGFVGVHSATDTEYDWPWYNKLVGAYFKGHPAIQEATLNVLDQSHPSTQHLDTEWIKKDEWYNFKNINPEVSVLIEIDEDTYEGGSHGTDQHPMSWYHEYDGGRAFYTGLGHTKETFSNPTFLEHLLGGINYAIGNNILDYSKATTMAIPDETRFVNEVLDFNLDEPMELDELPGKGIIFIERRGELKLYDFETASTRVLDTVDVFYANEDGLLGIAVDPNYESNNWIYLCYSAPGDEPKQHVSRFDLIEDKLIKSSEKILLTIPTIRKCCHSGGSIEFDHNGYLYVGLGDNTNPFESAGYAPIDERPGRQLWDAQRSASNTNDLRGKILRIKPTDDGSYTIPAGNLFPEGKEGTRPEIYAMGLRNPFRFSVDSKTSYLYWGDVGPDAGANDSIRGPKGMGEFNQARKAGYWGWPYTRGNNQAYGDFNFQTNVTGAKFDPKKIINDSPNNTGIKNLPPIQPSMVWYSYDDTRDFPWVGEGGVNPMAGPVFHQSDFEDGVKSFPSYFENKLFLYEWMRDWIYVVTLDENQDYVKAEPFMPSTAYSHPMDMIFGSDGHLYILEYGQKWNSRNMDARLNRIKYLSGNRPPIAAIDMDTEVGAAPLTVNFSANNSKDYDQDALTYTWSYNGDNIPSSDGDGSFTFDTPGIYDIQLEVTDALGESVTTTKKLLVGNEPPKINIKMDSENLSFWKGKEINYTVTVDDKEDGSTSNNKIVADDVKVTLNYIPEGEDMIIAAIGHQQNAVPKGLELINNSDCKSCHAIDENVSGPSYKDVANKYSKDDKNLIVSRIIKGSNGVWGETLMSAHPQLAVEDVEEMVSYILSLDSKKGGENDHSIPIRGTVKFTDHKNDQDNGKYILMASYLDKGHPEVEGSNLSAQEKVVFSSLRKQAEDADKSEGLAQWTGWGATLVGSLKHNCFLKYSDIDFSGLSSVTIAAKYGKDYEYKGTVEVRENNADGTLLGQTEVGYFSRNKPGGDSYKINLQPSSAKGNLFIVFKNEDNPDQYAMNADWVYLDYSE